MLTIFPASTGSFEIIHTRLETSLITASTNDDNLKRRKFYGPCSDFYPSSLGLWKNIYTFIIKLSKTLRFLLVESPVTEQK